jgi:mannose-6-phosphate isomerase-like protein (cupin superfamily)
MSQKGGLMKTSLLGILGLVVTMSQSQTRSPGAAASATDIPHAEIATVLQMGQTDQQLKVADLGRYNVGVGVLHRGATASSGAAGVNGLSHNQVAEVYYILSGGGTLVTGGTMAEPKDVAASSTTVTVLVGPSRSGAFRNGQSRTVGPGDVVIIPAGVPHGFSDIPNHVDYLAVRVDPDHVLPAGYVHEAIKRTVR